MFPFKVDLDWYDNYWLSDPPPAKHSAVSRALARLAVLVVLVAGSGVVLSHYHDQPDGSGYQSWEQE